VSVLELVIWVIEFNLVLSYFILLSTGKIQNLINYRFHTLRVKFHT